MVATGETMGLAKWIIVSYKLNLSKRLELIHCLKYDDQYNLCIINIRRQQMIIFTKNIQLSDIFPLFVQSLQQKASKSPKNE